MSQNVFTIGMMGGSDVVDRSCRDWPRLLQNRLQIGKQSLVKAITFGHEGEGSVQWFARKEHVMLANQVPDVAIISFINDGNPAQGISSATSLSNMYTVVDLIRARRSSTKIYFIKMWRLPPATEAAVIPNISQVFANFATVAANRANVGIIDCYSLTGNASDHPDEWNLPGDIHPLLPWHHRLSIQLCYDLLEPMIT